MIIIEQNFNKVPLCLEGTKENSPFAVSGPALVFCCCVGDSSNFVFWKNEKLQENDPDQMQTWQWTWLKGRGNMWKWQMKYEAKAEEIWNKGRGNMWQRQRKYETKAGERCVKWKGNMYQMKRKYVSNEKEICDKIKGNMWQPKGNMRQRQRRYESKSHRNLDSQLLVPCPMDNVHPIRCPCCLLWNVQNTSCTSCIHHMIGRWKSHNDHHKIDSASDN